MTEFSTENPLPPKKPVSRIRKWIRRLIIIGTLGIIALGLVIMFYGGALLHASVEMVLSHKIGAPVSVESVRLNPFGEIGMTINGLVITMPDGQTPCRIASLQVSTDISGLRSLIDRSGTPLHLSGKIYGLDVVGGSIWQQTFAKQTTSEKTSAMTIPPWQLDTLVLHNTNMRASGDRTTPALLATLEYLSITHFSSTDLETGAYPEKVSCRGFSLTSEKDHVTLGELSLEPAEPRSAIVLKELQTQLHRKSDGTIPIQEAFSRLEQEMAFLFPKKTRPEGVAASHSPSSPTPSNSPSAESRLSETTTTASSKIPFLCPDITVTDLDISFDDQKNGQQYVYRAKSMHTSLLDIAPTFDMILSGKIMITASDISSHREKETIHSTADAISASYSPETPNTPVTITTPSITIQGKDGTFSCRAPQWRGDLLLSDATPRIANIEAMSTVVELSTDSDDPFAPLNPLTNLLAAISTSTQDSAQTESQPLCLDAMQMEAMKTTLRFQPKSSGRAIPTTLVFSSGAIQTTNAVFHENQYRLPLSTLMSLRIGVSTQGRDMLEYLANDVTLRDMTYNSGDIAEAMLQTSASRVATGGISPALATCDNITGRISFDKKSESLVFSPIVSGLHLQADMAENGQFQQIQPLLSLWRMFGSNKTNSPSSTDLRSQGEIKGLRIDIRDASNQKYPLAIHMTSDSSATYQYTDQDGLARAEVAAATISYTDSFTDTLTIKGKELTLNKQGMDARELSIEHSTPQSSHPRMQPVPTLACFLNGMSIPLPEKKHMESISINTLSLRGDRDFAPTFLPRVEERTRRLRNAVDTIRTLLTPSAPSAASSAASPTASPTMPPPTNRPGLRRRPPPIRTTTAPPSTTSGSSAGTAASAESDWSIKNIGINNTHIQWSHAAETTGPISAELVGKYTLLQDLRISPQGDITLGRVRLAMETTLTCMRNNTPHGSVTTGDMSINLSGPIISITGTKLALSPSKEQTKPLVSIVTWGAALQATPALIRIPNLSATDVKINDQLQDNGSSNTQQTLEEMKDILIALTPVFPASTSTTASTPAHTIESPELTRPLEISRLSVRNATCALGGILETKNGDPAIFQNISIDGSNLAFGGRTDGTLDIKGVVGHVNGGTFLLTLNHIGIPQDPYQSSFSGSVSITGFPGKQVSPYLEKRFSVAIVNDDATFSFMATGSAIDGKLGFPINIATHKLIVEPTATYRRTDAVVRYAIPQTILYLKMNEGTVERKNILRVIGTLTTPKVIPDTGLLSIIKEMENVLTTLLRTGKKPIDIFGSSLSAITTDIVRNTPLENITKILPWENKNTKEENSSLPNETKTSPENNRFPMLIPIPPTAIPQGEGSGQKSNTEKTAPVIREFLDLLQKEMLEDNKKNENNTRPVEPRSTR